MQAMMMNMAFMARVCWKGSVPCGTPSRNLQGMGPRAGGMKSLKGKTGPWRTNNPALPCGRGGVLCRSVADQDADQNGMSGSPSAGWASAGGVSVSGAGYSAWAGAAGAWAPSCFLSRRVMFVTWISVT